MGAPSDRRRAQRRQRPGRRERARAKKSRRRKVSVSVSGAGTFVVRAGRKKRDRVYKWVRAFLLARLGGDAVTPKDGTEIKRPLYTISVAGFAVPGGAQSTVGEWQSGISGLA